MNLRAELVSAGKFCSGWLMIKSIRNIPQPRKETSHVFRNQLELLADDAFELPEKNQVECWPVDIIVILFAVDARKLFSTHSQVSGLNFA